MNSTEKQVEMSGLHKGFAWRLNGWAAPGQNRTVGAAQARAVMPPLLDGGTLAALVSLGTTLRPLLRQWRGRFRPTATSMARFTHFA